MSSFRVIPVPCRADNYMYILLDEASGKNAVVDPFDVAKLEAAAAKEGIKLGETLLLTHHHQDHSGGNDDFIKKFPDVQVFAGSNTTGGVTRVLKHNEAITIGSTTVTALSTPCHTQDHLCLFVEDADKKHRGVFTGDTLFVSGCGRFFEGTGIEMDHALNGVLAALPDDTVTYVGHEYTASNVAFSASIDPNNEAIKSLVKYAAANEVTTGKFTIGDEKAHNVFMRLNSLAVSEKTKTKVPGDAMDILRELKNNFRG